MQTAENEFMRSKKGKLHLYARSKDRIFNAESHIQQASQRLQGAEIRRGDGWTLAKTAGDGDLVLIDTSYLNKKTEQGKTKKTANYNKATEEDAVPEIYQQKITDNLLDAWDKGAKLVITNNWDEGVASFLTHLGFTVIADTRAQGVSNDTRELIATNFNPVTGTLNARRTDLHDSTTGRTAKTDHNGRDENALSTGAEGLAGGVNQESGTVHRSGAGGRGLGGTETKDKVPVQQSPESIHDNADVHSKLDSEIDNLSPTELEAVAKDLGVKTSQFENGESAVKQQHPDDIRAALDKVKSNGANVDADSGNFGKIYREFYHDADGAIAKLTELQDGEAIAALHHPEVGDIDLVWGKEGTAKSDGYGLAKLIKYHPEVLGDLQGLLLTLTKNEKRSTDRRIQLESKDHQAGIKLDWDGKQKTWLLTAFEKRTGNNTSTDTIDITGKDDTARSSSSLDKSITTSPENATGNEEKLTTKGTTIYEPKKEYGVSETGADNAHDAGWRNNALQRPQVVNAKTSTIKTGLTEVNSPQDALHVISSFSNYAQEQMVALVLGANNKVLQIVRHTAGLNDSSMVDPGVLAGSIHGIKGAKSVYFAHNHPSGKANQSKADRDITDKLTELLRGTGIESKGMLVTVIGNEGTFYNSDEHVEDIDITETHAERTKNIPVTERHLISNTKIATESITGEDIAVRVANIIANGREGVLLLDTQNTPVSFIEMSASNMNRLRTNKTGTGASLLLKEIHETNARAMMMVIPKPNYDLDNYADIAKNLGAFANNTGYTRMLDGIIGRKGLVSEGYYFNRQTPYFSKSQSQVTNPHTKSTLHAAISKALDKVFGKFHLLTAHDKPYGLWSAMALVRELK